MTRLVTAIPAAGRLHRVIQDIRLRQAQARQLAEFARETEQPLPTPRASMPGDQLRLRGMPAVGGRGSAGGAIRGSRPDVDAFRGCEWGAAHALAVLIRDEIDGSSPGTQPEQALLDAEAEKFDAFGGE